MSRKVDALRDKKTELVISDRGCTTGGTEFVVKFDYQGFKTHECSENICWTSPPDRLILDANATDASAAGSRHSFSGPNYVPTREQPTQVCFPVYARSPDRDIGARGWQKLNVTVTHEKRFTTTEMTGLAVACAREGAK